jgi:hypothetical protein
VAAYVAAWHDRDLVVHLVRDPRALAWSSHRLDRRLDPGPDQPPHPTLRAVALLAVSWRNDNRAASRLGGTTLRYEDLAVDPEGVCAGLWRSLGLPVVRRVGCPALRGRAAPVTGSAR